MRRYFSCQALFVTILSLSCFAAAAPKHHFNLWYTQPASQWTEALPIGNGHMGAMVYGRTDKETIQFNEESLWTGHPTDYQHPDAAGVLPQLRQLLFEGKQKEAEKLAQQHFMSVPLRQNAFQPMGNVILEFEGHDNPTDYKRWLDLKTGISGVTYTIDGVTYKREIFASYPDKAIIIRLTADKPQQIKFKATLTSPHKQSEQFKIDDTILGLRGHVAKTGENENESKMQFQAVLRIHHASAEISNDGIRLDRGNSATLILTAATNYQNYKDLSGDPMAKCRGILEKLKHVSYQEHKTHHLKDYQALYNRVSIDLGSTNAVNLQTDDRVLNYSKAADPQLAALLFQYGRYLLISSSRPGSHPATLQGVWNDRLSPPWGSKYTVNINTEMNYWPAEMTNLSECHQPLFDMLKDCSQTGALTAKTFYDCPGWVLHHNTDIWRGTAPINASNHGIWPTGGAWLCQHLWWHYAYTLDEAFLRTTAYPIMKSAAEFFTEYLIEDPRNNKGWLISGPSNSPENGGLVMGPTMDHQIIRNLFDHCIEASEILGMDAEFRQRLTSLRKRIAPNQIGKHGQLQEWLEDKDDPNNKHRHVSHLWGLHPGNEITRDGTPELYEAAKQSLLFRGDKGTGWSMGWKINFWARLHDGDHALKIMKNLLRLTGSSKTSYKGGGVYPNLFDSHPPFQIDGNFGATSGIAEMLMQSHAGFIELLPALPSAWKDGSITGLKARGGFEVDVYWQDGTLAKAVISSQKGGNCRLQYAGTTLDTNLSKGGQKIYTAGDFK